MHDNANLLMRPVQLGLPFIARIFHGPLYNSEGKSLSCAVPEHQLALLAMPTADFSSNLSYDNENAKRWQTFRYVRSDTSESKLEFLKVISRKEYFKLFHPRL